MRILGALLLAAAIGACSTSYDGSAKKPSAPLVAAPAESPYVVEVLGDSGAVLQTFDAGGKFYVLGDAGARYQIHITNPTAVRVEAVVSVDGLDVVDGEDADLRKRGYVVPPGGDLRIEGFRTSTSEVATFRFSSVDASYAGRKGKARNVGVIAVALFAEAAPVEIIVPDEPVQPTYTYEDDRADKPASKGGERSGGSGGYDGDDQVGPSDGRMRRPTHEEVTVDEGESERPYEPDPCCQQTHRPGLGTEYGEQRTSAVTWTKFVRVSDTPTAVAELRYNDAGGLAALGIVLGDATASPSEITVRETADPFPGDPSFSTPPR